MNSLTVARPRFTSIPQPATTELPCTPPVQTSVLVSIVLPSFKETVVLFISVIGRPVKNCTPRFCRLVWARSINSGAKPGRMLGAASTHSREISLGSIAYCRQSPGSMSANSPTSSTPVSPPPPTTKVASALFLVLLYSSMRLPHAPADG